MLMVAAAMLFLTGTPDPQANQVEPAIVEARPQAWRSVPADEAIIGHLNQLVRDEPNRVVCFRPPVRAGTRLTHKICRTLIDWYQFEQGRNASHRVAAVLAAADPNHLYDPAGPGMGPPYELVDMIKERYRSPKARSSALQHARERAEQADTNADTQPG